MEGELDKVDVSEGMEMSDGGVEINEGIDGIETVGNENDSDAKAELNTTIIHNSNAAINKNFAFFFIEITFSLFIRLIFSISVYYYKKNLDSCKYKI